MKNIDFRGFIRNPKILISLILAVFFLKGVFLTALFPIFKGQDESRHYNSIQFLNEPEEKTWEITEKDKGERDKEDLGTYNYSEEIRNTAAMTDTETVRSREDYAKMSFFEGFLGKNEAGIIEGGWDPFNKTYPPDVVQGSLYHKIASIIERILSEQNIFVRYFSLRVFSVFLGTVAVLFFYLTVKKIGFSEKQSLLMTAILSFQPRFSLYMTNINYDSLLIPAFFLFAFAGMSILKNGFDWKNTPLILLSLASAILTKGTGMALLPVLIGLVLFQMYKKMDRKKFLIGLAGLSLMTTVVFMVLDSKYDFSFVFSLNSGNSSAETLSSAGKYLSDTFFKIPSPDEGYWGDIDWMRGDYSEYLITLLWIIQLAAMSGLVWIFFSKKYPDFLPEKKYLVLLFGIWLALQAGIRFFDWKYSLSDPDLPLGAPGRYFLPTLTSHLILIFVGLGMVLRKKERLDIALKAVLVLMFGLFMHSVFNSIIPQLYL